MHLDTVDGAHILEYQSPSGQVHYTYFRGNWESKTFRTIQAAKNAAMFWRTNGRSN